MKMFLPREMVVVQFFDPADDLDRRARAWGHDLPDHGWRRWRYSRPAWRRRRREAGTVTGRISRPGPSVTADTSWEIESCIGPCPGSWRCPLSIPPGRAGARAAAGELLALGDRYGLASVGGEGAHPPGEDAFGLLATEHDPLETLKSLWSGLVLMGEGPGRRLGSGSGRRPGCAWLALRTFRAGRKAVESACRPLTPAPRGSGSICPAGGANRCISSEIAIP